MENANKKVAYSKATKANLIVLDNGDRLFFQSKVATSRRSRIPLLLSESCTKVLT